MNLLIPLAILSISLLAFILLIRWSIKGAGNRRTRILLTAAFVLLQVYAWILIVVVGAFHQIGLWAMGLCFVTAIIGFFIPKIHSKFNQNNS